MIFLLLIVCAKVSLDMFETRMNSAGGRIDIPSDYGFF